MNLLQPSASIGFCQQPLYPCIAPTLPNRWGQTAALPQRIETIQDANERPNVRRYKVLSISERKEMIHNIKNLSKQKEKYPDDLKIAELLLNSKLVELRSCFQIAKDELHHQRMSSKEMQKHLALKDIHIASVDVQLKEAENGKRKRDAELQVREEKHLRKKRKFKESKAQRADLNAKVQRLEKQHLETTAKVEARIEITQKKWQQEVQKREQRICALEKELLEEHSKAQTAQADYIRSTRLLEKMNASTKELIKLNNSAELALQEQKRKNRELQDKVDRLEHEKHVLGVSIIERNLKGTVEDKFAKDIQTALGRRNSSRFVNKN